MADATSWIINMDRIIINGLSARCVIGVSEEERREKQDVEVNVAVETDIREAAKSDRFADALDYRALKKKIVNLVENSRYTLLESLAEAVAEACLEDKKASGVQVRVEKPSALRFARSVGIEIYRKSKT